MSERFTQDDARRIFARAAERQRVADDAPADGLSLEELQEIGRAAGLDPAHVAAAVADLRSGADEPAPTFLGIPMTVRRTRTLAHPVPDDVWERVVADLRSTFDRPGTASQIGRLREWSTPSPNGGGHVRVVLEPTGTGGTRVTATAGDKKNAAQFRLISWMFTALTALFTLVVPFEIQEDPTIWGLPLTFAVLFASVVGLVLWIRHAGLKKHARQFDGLLDRIDLLSRNEAVPEPLAEPPRQPEIDPALLDTDAPEPAAARRSRRRRRDRT